MNVSSLIQRFFALTLLISLLACQDHQVQSPQRFRLKRTLSNIPGLETTVTYTYNNIGKVATSVSRQNEGETSPGRTTVYLYDAQGRLVGTETDAGNGLGGGPSRTTYEYDANGNVSLERLYVADAGGNYVLSATIIPEYGSGKLPVRITVTTNQSTSVTNYTYANENVVQTERTVNNGPPEVTTYQYDDKPNPLYGLVASGPGYFNQSKNNVLNPNFTYTYNANGLLTIRQGTLQRYVYEYEPY